MGFRARTQRTIRSDSARGAIVPFTLVGVACVAVAAGGPAAFAALSFDRDAIEAGAVWRLLTAHLVHLGTMHLALNLVGLALIGWITGGEFRWPAWVAIGLASGLSVSGSLYAFHPEVSWYVGLSGVLHGLLAGGIVPGVARRRPESLLLLAVLLFKLAWEAVAGPIPGSAETAGGPVLVEAHRYGALGGAAAGLLARFWERSVRSV
ncbi:MAG: rhombosortase [Gammaproteobacteria bacterium]